MSARRTITAALAGDPNTGKSTFFNAWTGLHQVTGNWPGVTVEKVVGEIDLPGGERLALVDLPGMYSLHAVSEDERVASAYARSGEPDLLIDVVDAVNLERNLYLTLALMELGKPMVVVLTMTDVLRRQGFEIDVPELSRRLGVPVVLHDPTLDRTSNAHGSPEDYTLSELKTFNFSFFKGGHETGVRLEKPEYPEMPIPTFEEILADLKNKVFMNIQLTRPAAPFLKTICSASQSGHLTLMKSPVIWITP